MLTSNFYLIHYQLINYLSNPLLFWGSLVAQSLKNLPTMQETGDQSLGHEDPLEKEMATHSNILAQRIFACNLPLQQASLVAQRLKRLPAMLETPVRSLGWEDPLEKAMAPHSSTIAWKIPWTEEPVKLQSMGSQRVGHD